MSGLYATALETICGPYLQKPKTIPMAWGDMTPSEQAMALWFAREHFDPNQLEEFSRHIVAQTAKKNGGYDLETSNNIFSMCYDNKH